MFDASQLMFMYVETPLHAGTGRSMGVVDLPLQRERLTDYPMVQASGIKGVLRSATKDKWPADDTHRALFGPEAGDDQHDHAGALSVGDARLLLFPVRSLAGVFAWTTSRDALARFEREVAMTGFPLAKWNVPTVQADEALVSGKSLVAGGQVVLEEFSFTPKTDGEVAKIGQWLATHALPESGEYAYWREMLPQKLCILSEDAFRDFVKYTTEVQTHIKLDSDTKTVDKDKGALWTTESLPTDTLLYVPLMATPSRAQTVQLSGKEVIEKLVGADLPRLQVGGNQTTGQGMVAVRMYDGKGGVL